MGPDEALFREHLASDAYVIGEARGKWQLVGGPDVIVWPNPVFCVQANRRFVPSGKLYLRLDLLHYPQHAPTGCPWNIEANARLDSGQWPKGGGNVSRVFNPAWNPSALYAPCDRVAMGGHDAWQQRFPNWWWKPTFTFIRYLQFVHITLNPNEAEPAT